ncbi:MAG: molybdopterin-dependent oxidoreductase [Acidobacteriota bacterium]|nr:molybdopterin-dependent oxidoreductase [Blastocatellia bacterium]MDW8238087.1 molybdopterin-dependent oxidoreductase [Acidobacteriota bacterium]
MNETIIPTTCVMDCPDTCALEVVVRDGTIHRIRGSKAHPTTNGFICDKVARFARRVYHQRRLLYPMRRVGPKGTGQFQRIGWDEAIAEITTRLRDIIQRWGGEAILPYHYGGSNGFLTEEFLDDYYFAKLGASRLAKTLCAGPATAVAQGMYGKMPGVAFEDFSVARFILIWGANPKVSNIHLMPLIKQAKQNGAFVAVIDPVNNFSDREIDLHLPILPGTDLPVALAMIRLWKEAGRLDYTFLRNHADGVEPLLRAADAWPLERAAREADVTPEAIQTLAEVYAASTPAVIRCGWGTERNRNGGQAIAAILAMPALLGKFGVRGGGYTLSNSGAARLDISQIFGPLDWHTRIINMSQLGRVLTGDLQPPIKALFVYNCNPAVTVPDQNLVLRGLAREDLFTVVFEQVMTDTALYADILLPATTFLEHHDIKRAYGNYVVGGVQPAIAPRGQAKSNLEVFALLGRAMGWTDQPFHLDAQASLHRVAAALSLHGKPAEAATLSSGRPHDFDFPGRTPIQFQTVFPLTPDGKIHLTPACLGDHPFHYQPVRNERFPLAMISPATSKMITSTMGEYNYPTLWLTMHPTDAAARAISDGDQLRVFNELGEVICRARVSDKIRPGVVSMPKGAWRHSSGNGLTATALAPAHVNEVGGGACYNDARVQVEKWAG